MFGATAKQGYRPCQHLCLVFPHPVKLSKNQLAVATQSSGILAVLYEKS